MAHASRERRLSTVVVGQILVWVLLCAMAVGVSLATLAMVKC
jgi:hypothetical protein